MPPTVSAIIRQLDERSETVIYLDNAATTLLKPLMVKQAVLAAMDNCANPGRSGHKPAMAAAEAVFSCRETAAAFFGLPEPERVVFTQNATHALNIAIKSALHQGGHAVVTGYEHNSVVRPLEAMAEQGVTYTVAASKLFDPQDMVEQIGRAIRPDTKCVIVNHVSNVFGFVAPLEQIDALCARRGLPLIVDASQSAGVLPLDCSRFQSVIFVCMPGHKGLYGPQGTGILLCCKGCPLHSLTQGGTGSNSLELTQPAFLPDVFESGTLNVPGIAGLEAGIRFLQREGLTAVGQRERELADRFAEQVQQVPGVCCYHCPSCQAGVVAITGPIPSEELAGRLGAEGICTRAGLHCSPLAHRSAGTLPDGAVRFSFSWFNTRQEAEAAALTVKKVLKDAEA